MSAYVRVMLCARFTTDCSSVRGACWQAIILTGIPGGIDYVLLIALGEGRLTRATYKDMSAHINCWIRAPLGFLGGYVCLLGLYRHLDEATTGQACVLTLLVR